ncbi:MAG: 4Fe-4S binding protein [Cytophagales bacterium]|nr:4Fe-4S binding protein [Armatimonadota bacterium]
MSRQIYVIAEPCIGVKDRSCVAVCPVDCIHGGEKDPQLYIDPNECIGCGLCESECPVDAIFLEDELPAKWKDFMGVNARFFETSPPGK